MQHTTTALTSWAKAIRKALETAGHDPRPLFAQAKLDMAALDNPNARYPVEGTTRLWQLAVQATADPAFGLVVARHVNQTSFHALGYSLIASTTLKEAFERMVRYFRIVTDAADLEFTDHGDECRFAMHMQLTPDGPHPSFEAIDAMSAIIVRMCRGLYVRSHAPLRVQLRRPAPPDLTPYERMFRAPIEFGAAENLLVFARGDFERPLDGANPELARHNDEVVVKYLAHFDRHNITNRVHAVLIEQLSLGEPSQEKIAQALHMSLRNLQRKLADEGTSYKEILNDTRRELALSYMKDARWSVSEITYLLGFSDTSSFTRAFRRWTGMAPTQYRPKSTDRSPDQSTA